MICTNCPNSNYKNTGVPSCFLPHCAKDKEVLAKRYAELSMKAKSDEDWAEYHMIREELQIERFSQKYLEKCAEIVRERQHGSL